ncbi:MAG: N-acetylmuramoyl-L-alanine amidase [Proteobacteria bacterium]|nr:N-acetylmuramoyl-L-alanine amidase [Pseudomonadota bacterium]
MAGLIINGKEVDVEGVDIVNFVDRPDIALDRGDGGKRRTKWVRMQIDHTTKGIPGGKNRKPQSIRPGKGPDRKADFSVVKMWRDDPRHSAAHCVIDADGSVVQLADLFSTKAFHASNVGVNEFSVGWEMFQEKDASLWEITLDIQVKLNIAVCRALGIQMQVHRPYRNGPLDRLMKGGSDCVGVFGHRDVTNNRGQGDPGDFIFDKLVEAGFEVFDFAAGEDREVWKERQDRLDLVPDGLPGPQTVARLKEAGYRDGIWALGKAEDQSSKEPADTRVCELTCPFKPFAQLITPPQS